MSSLAAARCSSSTASLFLPRKTLSDEEQSQMMREERVYQADGTRGTKTYVLSGALVLVGVVHVALSPMQDRA